MTYLVMKNNKLVSFHNTLALAKKRAKSEAEKTGSGHRVYKDLGVFVGTRPSKFFKQ